MTVSRGWLVCVTCWVACGGASAAPAAMQPPAAAQVATPAPVEPRSASRPAPDPLPAEPAEMPPCPEDPGRDGRQMPDHVLDLVELSDGMTVVDLGSGDGYFLCRLSRAVGPRGRVIATEIEEGLVRDLNERVAREALSNVDVVRAPTDDVGIAPGTADRILV